MGTKEPIFAILYILLQYTKFKMPMLHQKADKCIQKTKEAAIIDYLVGLVAAGAECWQLPSVDVITLTKNSVTPKTGTEATRASYLKHVLIRKEYDYFVVEPYLTFIREGL